MNDQLTGSKGGNSSVNRLNQNSSSLDFKFGSNLDVKNQFTDNVNPVTHLATRQNSSQNQSSKTTNNTGLPDTLKSGVEGLSGHSMDDVKVHYNSSKPAQLQALAYAQGTDIHVGPGQEQHLPHEAWHVVQQKQGRVRANKQLKGKGVGINDDSNLEREADVMGAKALQSEGKGSATQLKSANPTNNVVQGKFGFELELTIAVEAKQGSKYQDPKLANGNIHLGETENMALHVDHQESKAVIGDGVVDNSMYDTGGAPIIEVVTKPLDEFGDNIDSEIGTLATDLNNLQSGLMAARGQRKPLKDIMPQAKDKLVVGGKKKGRQNTNSYTHATYGVKLSQVPQVFTNHAEEMLRQRGDNSQAAERAGNLTKAVAAATEVSDWIFNEYKDKTSGLFRWKKLNIWDIHTQEDMDNIKGVLTLLANYMITYTRVKGKLMKNHVGVFFYKSNLSKLISGLSEKQRNLLNKKNDGIAKKLIEKCVEQRKDTLDSNVDWKGWVKEVIKGKNDRILNKAKNGYSPELGPDDLGPGSNKEKGVVMENRYIAELLQGYGKKIPPNNWRDMIMSVKDYLKNYNG
ncbi:DUF4157 domain-containing protein [Fulvivirga ulvae]|uniref:eCIS core domain-containing protein n=1 Tax=Fulvivirga ulvae TaxID=2904245 RepID=UPI001F317D0C|nr:DUF4157 domain-containing protein [Fulvivirga ulvae]UII32605.1 DUF4157 domain-containing protein [Fulvivirga ulvae]